MLLRASRVVVPALVLAEIDYFLRDDRLAMASLVDDVLDPRSRYQLEPTIPADVRRAMGLDAKFAGLKLGLVDGMVAAVAERLGISRVLTIDRADFGPLRIGTRFDRALEIVPALQSAGLR